MQGGSTRRSVRQSSYLPERSDISLRVYRDEDTHEKKLKGFQCHIKSLLIRY